jgi:hypothetical protein
MPIQPHPLPLLHRGCVRVFHPSVSRPARAVGRANDIRWQVVAMLVELDTHPPCSAAPRPTRPCEPLAARARISCPLSPSRSNAYRNTRPSWRRYRSRSNTGSPSPLQATASPSIRNDRARSAHAASAISGNRPVQSCPLRVKSRTPAGSRRTIMRKPSSLTSWIQPGPDGRGAISG